MSACAPGEPRSCPLCGSAQAKTVLELDPASVFKANWSYRPEKLAEFGASALQPVPLVRCTGCGLVFVGTAPDRAVLTAIYETVIDEDAARSANLGRDNLAYRMDYLSTLLRLLPASASEPKVLDYGCGFGPTLQLLAAIPGLQALGFDTSPVRIQELKRRGLPATLDVAEVAAAGPFDAVILDNVLEHLPEPVRCLEQLRPWCKPGAFLYVSVPEIGPERWSAYRRSQSQGLPLPMDLNPWEHLNYFDLPRLDRLLETAGFTPILQSGLPRGVDIGLRPERSRWPRLKNALASARRLARYVLRGDAAPTATMRFYRMS